MSAGTAWGIVLGVATFVGLALSVIYGRRGAQKVKLLVYSATVLPIPLASTRSLAEYDLLLMHEPTGGSAEKIEDAYVHRIRFANFGREPIRRDDIAPSNPLRIEIKGTRVLDATIEAVHRDVCAITLGTPVAADTTTSIPVSFDFLDFRDGALTRVMTDSRPTEITLVGDIVGMPAGIRRPSELEGRRKKWLGRVGTTLIVMFELLAVAVTPFVFKWVTGSWANVWLMALPVVALIVPLAISALVATTVWPKDRIVFPKELDKHGLGLVPPFFFEGDDRLEMHMAFRELD